MELLKNLLNNNEVTTFGLHPFAGAAIKACRATGRHIIALEKDSDVFKGVLEKMKKDTPIPVATEVEDDALIEDKSDNPDAVVVTPWKFVRKKKSCK